MIIEITMMMEIIPEITMIMEIIPESSFKNHMGSKC